MEPIAIIGISCLFPGAHTPDEFWRNLLAETDSTSSATTADMGVPPETFFNPAKGQRDKFYAMRGGYVRDFVFDPSGYRLPADFLNSLDSLFHWPLYVAREALRNSGYLNSEVGARTGVVLGNLSFPTKTSQHLFAPLYQTALTNSLQDLLHDPQFQLPRLDPPARNHLANALISGYPASVIAQALGLSSVHLALDAACASSLYAVKLACDYLQARKTDLMLAGAVSCADPFFIKMGFSIFQAYPDNDQSCPLDRTSQGLISGEGAGMFVLKRLADAERDGDQVYAVLRGIGLSNDGKGKHLLTPNPKGQLLAFERAYAAANIAPEEIDYIECHATGTPLGDITELNSMEAFFGGHHTTPLIGSVKSNFGHLLTAAGMGGMLKVILSMAHHRLPATIKVREPHASQNNLFGERQIVRQSMVWPNSGDVKRAAVSAFGFGGTNAHLVLENKPSSPASSSSPGKPASLAITGMAAHFGSCASLSELRQALYAGRQLFTSLPPQRWKGLDDHAELLSQYGISSIPPGAYLSSFEMDFLYFKIPPNDQDQPIPQQLLMLKVADAALQDAKMKPGGNVAVLIAMDTELALHEFRGRVDLTWQLPAALERAGVTLTQEQAAVLEDRTRDSLHIPALVNQYTSFIGNIMASRIAALWDFSGPAFTISAAENSVSKALEVAQMLLSNGEVEAVVVGAVDLAGGIEHILMRRQMAPMHDHTTPPTSGFGQNSTGWLIGEGAGALVVQRADHATRSYAILEALACATATAEGVALAARTALQTAGLEPRDVGYIEVSAGGFPYQDGVEMCGLSETYKESECVMSSVKANIGHTFAAAGLASIIRATLCLSERYFPATPGWDAPKQPLPFTIAEQSQPWLTTQRIAAVSILSHDHTCAHFILRAGERTSISPESQHPQDGIRYQATDDLRLIPLAAPDLESLQAQLEEMSTAGSLSQAAQSAWKTYQANSSAPLRVMLISGDLAELRHEASAAQTGVPIALQNNKKWLTGKGSYFTPNPLRGPVAFVYPGAFNSYNNLSPDLFHLFPTLYTRFAQITSDPVLAIRADALYRRKGARFSDVERKDLDRALVDDPIAMVASGTGFATLYTLIMREWFNVQPAAALGYSLGEAAMMWALGIWTHGDEAARALRESDLFKTRVAGPKLALREAWKIDPSILDDQIWRTYVLMAPVEQVAECLKDEPHAFIAIINTPHEVVLAGDPAACTRIIARLNCHALRAPFDHMSHCPPMRSEYAGFDALHNWPVQETPDITCYSAASYEPTLLTTESIARNVSTVSTSQVDFPRLVRRAYLDGTRIFVELGPHRTCSRWIDTILGDEHHLALSINQKGRSDQNSLIRLLAQLAAHHVPLDLSPLFEDVSTSVAGKAGFVKRITLGGGRIADILLSEEYRTYFSDLPRRSAQPSVPASSISEEMEVLRGDWHTLMTDLVAPTRHLIPVNGNTIMTSAPISSPPAEIFLRPSERTLSPELLKLLHDYQRRKFSPPVPESIPAPVLIPAPKPSHVIWDESDLLKYAQGNIADVFGKEYALIDTYSRRVRLPMPPYLLVSRITKLDAKMGEYKPSHMTTEYDIPHNAWYSVDGQIPWAIAVEFWTM